MSQEDSVWLPGAISRDRVAELIVAHPGGRRRGSGYRVTGQAVLTAKHVVAQALSVDVRFDADLPSEWATQASVAWVSRQHDLAVVSIPPRPGETAVEPARFGRIGDRSAVLAVQAVGFPRWKFKKYDDAAPIGNGQGRYRDSHHAAGRMAVLSNWREGTLEITMEPPSPDQDPAVSPWEGMSGAAVWVGNRIVGVLAEHHPQDGPGRLAAARLDRALDQLGAADDDAVRALLGLHGPAAGLPDAVAPPAGERITSAYQAQVADIAPDRLRDRDGELGEMVRFCAGAEPYLWWQAEPWAGKSALLSWFVLHPPAGVDVVSFFITSSFPGQNDSDAFTDALIEQLSALAGEPTAAGSHARRGRMLQLLDAVARRCGEAGRQLLFVVDGLDEDAGPDADLPSIASLLPRRPPPALRVLVASRSEWQLPDDVLLISSHPLKTVIPYQLTASLHAADIAAAAKNELRRLLARPQLGRDVLGALTASGGGLVMRDLEELTGHPRYELDLLLSGRFGRSVANRVDPAPAVDRPAERIYLFAHDTLREIAEEQYGTSIAVHRDRLHAWAEGYRHRGWPDDTPLYLLRGYQRMLAEAGEVTRLLACATDSARHGRMLDVTGGDALAITEIATAVGVISHQPEPDLAALLRLAISRDEFAERNTSVSADLPAVWMLLGQPTRALAMANAISDPAARAAALTSMAATAASGHDRMVPLAIAAEHAAEEVAGTAQRSYSLAVIGELMISESAYDRAERLAAMIGHPPYRHMLLARLAQAVAVAGDYDRAERLAGEIGEDGERSAVLAALRRAAAADGDYDRAEYLATMISHPSDRDAALASLAQAAAAAGEDRRAERLAGQVTQPVSRALMFGALALTLAMRAEPERALFLATSGERAVEEVTEPGPRAIALVRLARALAASGDQGRAEALAASAERSSREIISPRTASGADEAPDWVKNLFLQTARYFNALDSLISELAAAGDYDRAERVIRQFSSEAGWQIEALAALAGKAATLGDHDRAARLALSAEDIAKDMTNPSERDQAQKRLAERLAASGDYDPAERLALEITETEWRSQALCTLVDAMALAGDYDRAERLAMEITDPKWQASALAALRRGLTAGGDYDRAERLTTGITDPKARSSALAELALALATAGENDRAARIAMSAERIARQITDPGWRNRAVDELAQALAAAGDYDRAERLTGLLTSPAHRALALAALAKEMASTGDRGQADGLGAAAERVLGEITDPGWRNRAVGELAQALAAAGDYDRAERLTAQLADPRSRARTLAALARAMAASGEHDRAECLANEIDFAESRAWALGGLAKELAVAGEHDQVDRLVTAAEQASGEVGKPWIAEASVRGELACALAAAGRHDRAERIIREIGRHPDGDKQVFKLAQALATVGEYDRARRLVGETPGEYLHYQQQTLALVAMSEALAESGGRDRKGKLADSAERMAAEIAPDNMRADTLTQMAQALTTAGDYERAERAARLIADPVLRATSLVRLAEELIRVREQRAPGDPASSRTPSPRRLATEVISTPSWPIALRLVGRLAPLALHSAYERLLASLRLPEAPSTLLHDNG